MVFITPHIIHNPEDAKNLQTNIGSKLEQSGNANSNHKN
jgi:type II secretory pathway component GspD/PulD (secretin)